MEYLILNKKATRSDGIAAWWKPKGAGYTDDVKEAGRYSTSEAELITTNSHSDNVAIPVEVVNSLCTKHVSFYGKNVIDTANPENRKKLLAAASL